MDRWPMLLPALLCACGTGADIEPPPPNDGPGAAMPDHAKEAFGGSRLRPVMGTVDGVGTFLHWRDTELGIDCDFDQESDGVWRCRNVQESLVVFADAECSQPAIMHSPCNAEPGLGRLATHTPECVTEPWTPNVPLSYATVPGAAPLQATAYHRGRLTADGLSCDDYPQALQGKVLVPVEPVAELGVAEATMTVVQDDVRVWRRELVTPGGARQVVGAFDADLGARCTARPTTDGVLRCIPAMGKVGGFFADASCEDPTAELSACPDALTQFASTYSEALDGCPYSQPFAVGEALEVPYNSSGGCHALTPTSGSWATLGAPVPSATFAQVPVATVGLGPWVLEFHSNDNGWRVAPNDPIFTHVGHGATCRFRGSTMEPETSCRPVDYSVSHYADAACTERVALRTEASCTPQHPYVGHSEGNGCVWQRFYQEVLEPIALDVVYGHSDGDPCAAIAVEPNETVHALGPDQPEEEIFPVVAIEVW